MNKQLAWILPLLLLPGCRTAQRTAVTVPAQPAYVRPADPVPVPTAPAPGSSPVPTQAGYFMPNCPCDTKPGAAAAPLVPSPVPAPAAAPSTAPTPSSPPQIQLSSPEPIAPEKGEGTRNPAPAAGQTPEPPRGKTPLLPAGIPQFTTARDGVAAGLRPSLDDGLDWLQANGYKTILHVRAPGEVNDADRKQVEKRDMKYLSLEVSPQTLDRQTLDQFANLAQNSALRPLFVYDRDGALAGGLWYWYFRNVDMQTDDVARIRAGALGLRENRDGTHRDMWLALQKIISDSQ